MYCASFVNASPASSSSSSSSGQPQSQRGLLPTVLLNLLSARSRAKKAMAEAVRQGDTQLATILNSRQLALKISASTCTDVAHG